MLANSQIKIIGVGGAGISVINDIADESLDGAILAAIDTDAAALSNCKAERKISLVENGEGSGGDTSISKEAAVAHAHEIETLAKGARLIILIAGLGGGTGSVIAPMISKIAGENPECTVVSFAIMPLSIEGTQRGVLALRAQNYLSKHCRAAFALQNDIILARLNTPIADAFKVSNSNIVTAVCSLVKMLTSKGIVNIDFPTFSKIFSSDNSAKTSFVAYGIGEGADAVENAVAELLKSPLIPENSSAKSMIVSLRCGENFEMNKMQMLLELAARKFGMPERMAFGAVNEEKFGGNIEVCAMGLCESNDESKTDQSDIGDRQAETKVEAPADAVEDIVENRSNKDDTITSTAEVEKTVSAPVASSAINTPPPVLAAPEKSERKSFFGFGKRKHQTKDSKSEEEKNQTEFKFMELSQQRGFFQDTPPNIRNGVDLDVPTYMRKGIKIVL